MNENKGNILIDEDLSKIKEYHEILYCNSIDAAILATTSGKILYANSATCQMFDRTEPEIYVIGQSGIFDSSDPRFSAAMDERSRTGKFFGELTGITKGGTTFPVELSSSVFAYIDGTELVNIIIRNITERKISEELLLESKNELELFFSQSTDGIFFMMMDEPVTWNDSVDKEKTLDYAFSHQRVTKLNNGMLAQYKATRESFINLTPNDFFAYDPAYGKKIWRQFFDAGKLHFETTERRFDGSQMDLEVDYVCLYDSEKRITGHFGIQKDITDRKLAEKSSLNSENKLRIHAQKTPLAAIEFDKEFHITSWNPAAEKIFGFTSEEAIGQHTGLIVPDSMLLRVSRLLQQVVNNGNSGVHTYENRTKTGKILTCEWYISPSYTADNIISGMTAFAIDVTERKQTENSLRESEANLSEMIAVKDKFFSIIAHDLKSPFNIIIGFSSILMELIKLKEYEGIEEYTESIQKSAMRGMDLLKNLLEWSRVQTGRMTFNPKYIDLVQLINESTELLKGSAQQKSISISKNLPEGVKVYADKEMVNTIIRNLISNAVKFTHPEGKISVSIKQRPNDCLISVQDNGVGMSNKELNTMFKLEEAHSTMGTQNEVGTGLGLLLSKEFVTKHGGKIWVESEVKKGSTFYFTIPRVPHSGDNYSIVNVSSDIQKRFVIKGSE